MRNLHWTTIDLEQRMKAKQNVSAREQRVGVSIQEWQSDEMPQGKNLI
jgi:hypothetical protein